MLEVNVPIFFKLVSFLELDWPIHTFFMLFFLHVSCYSVSSVYKQLNSMECAKGICGGSRWTTQLASKSVVARCAHPAALVNLVYTQFILIRNGSIRNASRIYGFFKKQLAALSNLRNRKSISIFLRNALVERFQNKKHMGR